MRSSCAYPFPHRDCNITADPLLYRAHDTPPKQYSTFALVPVDIWHTPGQVNSTVGWANLYIGLVDLEKVRAQTTSRLARPYVFVLEKEPRPVCTSFSVFEPVVEQYFGVDDGLESLWGLVSGRPVPRPRAYDGLAVPY